jgi:hypothetical protein
MGVAPAIYLIIVGAIGIWPHLLRGWHI